MFFIAATDAIIPALMSALAGQPDAMVLLSKFAMIMTMMVVLNGLTALLNLGLICNAAMAAIQALENAIPHQLAQMSAPLANYVAMALFRRFAAILTLILALNGLQALQELAIKTVLTAALTTNAILRLPALTSALQGKLVVVAITEKFVETLIPTLAWNGLAANIVLMVALLVVATARQ